MRKRDVLLLCLGLGLGGCLAQGDDTTATATSALDNGQAARRGRDIWFKNTYGGEKFFTFLANHPDPAKRIVIGFVNVVTTPRDQRFATWGTINDPDCVANPAGGMDICPDPNATGVVGIRKFPGPGGTYQFGAACAACHAGFDPVHPPADPEEPTWANINPTIGDQYADFGAIFAANLPANDPRRIMFAAWPRGTVDTSLLFNDNIMNPGTVTAFWNQPFRPHFDVGRDAPQLRNGQGGEDDLGGDVAARRVYTNIGVCFFECVAGPASVGQPIDIDACEQSCPDFPPQSDMDDLGTFLASARAPQYPGHVTNPWAYQAGRHVFERACESCHSDHGKQRRALTNDEVNPLVADPANATNACRSLSTNWQPGKIWAQFSSQIYKDRVAAGNRGYRTMPLVGIWATEPFMHNQSIGTWAPADASPAERATYFWQSMWELLSSSRTPKINVLPVAVGPFPAGTPLQYVFSRDPATGQVLCTDVVENGGHYYGADLSVWEKLSLIYWLQYQ